MAKYDTWQEFEHRFRFAQKYDKNTPKNVFLAHLSRRLMGELIVYQSLQRPSIVRRLSSVVGPSTISNIFSSETTGPIKFKLHMVKFGQGQICFLMHLNGKISEKLIFWKTVKALVIILTWYV